MTLDPEVNNVPINVKFSDVPWQNNSTPDTHHILSLNLTALFLNGPTPIVVVLLGPGWE